MYAMRARIEYINYAKKLRIFNILNLFCVVYMYVLQKARAVGWRTSMIGKLSLAPYFWNALEHTFHYITKSISLLL